MEKMTESQMVSYCRANAIRMIKVVPSEEGDGYYLLIVTNFAQTDFVMVTFKGAKRIWKSMDRLIAHINEKYSSMAFMQIYLKPHSQPHVGQGGQQRPGGS